MRYLQYISNITHNWRPRLNKLKGNTQIHPASPCLFRPVDEVAHGGALAAGADQLGLAIAGVHDVHEVLQGLLGPRAQLLLAQGDAGEQLHETAEKGKTIDKRRNEGRQFIKSPRT